MPRNLKLKFMNEPTYKIHGLERRKLKKELAETKHFVKNFWYFYQLEKDMHKIYGLDTEEKMMTKKQAQKMLDRANLKITEIEQRLSVLYVA